MTFIDKLLKPWTLFKQDEPEKDAGSKQVGGGGGGIIFFIIWLTFGLLAGFLSWRCNSKEYTGMRILYTLTAFSYGILYLIYYVIIRLLLGYEINMYTKIV